MLNCFIVPTQHSGQHFFPSSVAPKSGCKGTAILPNQQLFFANNFPERLIFTTFRASDRLFFRFSCFIFPEKPYFCTIIKKQNMHKLTSGVLALAASTAILLMASSCASRYAVSGVERTRLLVDAAYDGQPVAEATAFVEPYTARVDSIMKPVVGSIARDMSAHRPESELSNLLADILLWGADKWGEKPDFAVYNMGGIRAGFSKGTVNIGDVLDVAPFENKLCVLTLTGEKVSELFQQMAMVGGEGLSRGAKLTISKDHRLLEATVGGQPIDPKASYRIATLDYLAQGNDHLDAFKAKTDLVSPQAEENNVRHFIEDYFREKAALGQSVDAQLEGRITVEP